MSEQIVGLNLTTEGPVDRTPELEKLVLEQRDEINAMGCKVTGVHIVGENVPPRFFITFVPDHPSYTVRGRLEARGYDIGQQMGSKMLHFYASKRVSKGSGWTV